MSGYDFSTTNRANLLQVEHDSKCMLLVTKWKGIESLVQDFYQWERAKGALYIVIVLE